MKHSNTTSVSSTHARSARSGKLAKREIAVLISMLLGAAAFADPALAATITVTNLNDGGLGSLRQAIADANGSAGPDTIVFQSGLTGTITLTSGQLAISDSVDIQGPGAAVLSVSGNNASRVFYLYSSATVLDVSISGLTITGGSADIGGGIAEPTRTSPSTTSS
ncbi:MAG TPA: hypothetical protein VF132_15255 [Rudaea sp.]